MNIKLLSKKEIKKNILLESSDIDEHISLAGPMILKNGFKVDNIIQKYISSADSKRIIQPFIVDAILRSEYGSGGSGEICLNMISNNIRETALKMSAGFTISDIESFYDKEIKDIMKETNSSSSRANKDDIEALINNSFTMDVEKKISKTIVNKSNIKSPIFLERSGRRETTLYFTNGYNFEIPVSADMLPYEKTWNRKDVSILIIDGLIESVGEIHHVLDRAAEEKNPIIMFVRHLSDDVRSTLSLNIKRGTIDLIPVEVGFSEDTINILNDISIACNSDIISTHMGDLISTSGLINLSKVKSAIINEKGINIVNQADESSLLSHLKYLEERRNSSGNQALHSLFDLRIRSLSSGKIIIKVGDDLLNKDPLAIERFDKFFRELKSIVSNGVIYKSKIESDRIRCHLRDDYPYSSSSIFFAAKHAFSSIVNIFSIDRGIIEDSV